MEGLFSKLQNIRPKEQKNKSHVMKARIFFNVIFNTDMLRH